MKPIFANYRNSLTVVVPAYCQSELDHWLLERCLQSLKQQTCGDFEVIVVDDGSCDSFLPIQLKNQAPLRTQFLKNPRNQGRSISRNKGWQHAGSPLILFLDGDMFLQENAVMQHVQFHALKGENWIAQGHIVGQQSLAKIPQESFWTDASQAFFATGHVSVARSALIKTGGFDEGFSEYGWEDLELGLRLKTLGYRQKKLKSAVAYHYEPLFLAANWEQDLEKECQRARGALLLLQKHPRQARLLCQSSKMDALLAFVFMRLIKPAKVLPFLEKLQGAEPKMALALYRGILHQHYVHALTTLRRH